MTAPVHRPTVPRAVGVNRSHIQIEEAVRPWGPAVFLETHTTQTIPSSTDFFTATDTHLVWDSVVYRSPDSDGMVDLAGHPTRILIVRPGIYLVGGNVGWKKTTFSDPRQAGPQSVPVPAGTGGGGMARMWGDNLNPMTLGEAGFVAYEAGYQVFCNAIQQSGVPQDISGGTLGVQWVAPFGGY